MSEEELELWSACEKGSCLPTRFEDGRWKDRLAEKWGLLIQVAAEIADSRSAWRTMVDTRNAAEVDVVLVEESNLEAVIVSKRINAYETQYPSLTSLANAILEIAAEIKRNTQPPAKQLAVKLQYEHALEVYRQSLASLQRAAEGFHQTEQRFYNIKSEYESFVGRLDDPCGTLRLGSFPEFLTGTVPVADLREPLPLDS